jgi:hypothetical protein
MGKNSLYMKVTLDEYELPLAVADTATELAKMLDIKVNTIYTTMSHYKAGFIKKSPFVKVEFDEKGEKHVK